MGVTIGQLKLAISRRAHKDLGNFTHESSVESWAKIGIEKVEKESQWQWNRSAQTITLIADTYAYAWGSDLNYYDARSFHYGSRSGYLSYSREPKRIDDELGPNWRLASGTSGTPRYFAVFGRNFWIAPKPSSSFVASNPTVYFYGWISDLPALYSSVSMDATELMIPYSALELYTVGALTAGLQQEDDPDWVRFEEKFQREVSRQRAMEPSYNTDDYLEMPNWAKRMKF